AAHAAPARAGSALRRPPARGQPDPALRARPCSAEPAQAPEVIAMVTQARAFTTRDLIVKGAAIAFERYGYDGASLNDVFESAGTTKGALYFHFKTKQTLALKVVAAHHRRLVQAVQQ